MSSVGVGPAWSIAAVWVELRLRAAVRRSRASWVTLVGEVGALFISRFGVGEVEGVGLPAAAHRDVGPLAVGGPVDDHEGAVGGDALGFVAGHRVAVVDVPLLEVPDRQVSGFGVAVEAHREAAVVLVDGCDGGEVAVEYPEATLVFAAQDPVTRLEDPLCYLEGGSVEPVRCGEVGAGLLVEFGDGVVVVGDEQP